MPHITVDYSESLTEAFDRRGFALALHPLAAKIISTTPGACKTYFRRMEEIVVAGGEPEHAVIRIEAAILSGRTPETKTELSEAVMDLVRQYLAATPQLSVQTSVNVLDLDRTWYRSDTVDRTEGTV
ncbi:isomerase [Streptomyces sp. NBC_01537]|uniref:5-carboxymethyl-2-hydroxymuconate Delta-isomerase n=1 Tax=Streptomyces sp. NBC_01537 TaxID=2903896 RepID=UPI00386D6170